jgi:predicted ribonuclease toxin of YeeF-YezG toxin-antitoxin module
MKVIDVHGLHGAIDEIINELNRKNDQMKNIRHSIQQFISLEDSLKGKAGKAIREYFEDVKPFIGDKYVFKKNNTFT